MASKRQRKKNAKKLGTWEAQQYRGGRVKGKQNLKKGAGTVTNQYGVTFTLEQKKALERVVNRSNYQRKKMLAEEERLNPQATQLRLMGKESDFIITRQSKSLQRFKSMEDFEAYMDKQNRIQSGEYLDEKIKLYKRNYIKAVQNELDDPGIAMRIRMMKPDDFRRLVETHGDDMEISYVYDPTTQLARRNKIRSLIGLREVDEEDSFYNEE